MATLESIIDLSARSSFEHEVPHAAFARMRALPGLYWQATDLGVANGGFWAVTRHDDIVAVERDPATFSSRFGAAYPITNQDPNLPTSRAGIMTNDPPNHTRLRQAAAAGFGPRVIANFEPWVQEIVDEVLDSVDERPTYDFVTEICQTIPAFVVARVLGAPREDRPFIVQTTLDIFAATNSFEGLAAGEGTGARVQEQSQRQAEYVRRISDYKRKNPADDMFTMLSGCLDRGEITEPEFVQWLTLIMAAGFETTHTAFGQSMRMYLEQPEVAAIADAAIARGETDRVVDEFLRMVTPAMQMARTATRDVEFAGERIRKGDLMVMYFTSANRDAKHFADPDRFDPARPNKHSLVFGSGVHRCLGSFLARLEVRILYDTLARRGIRLRLDGEPDRGGGSIFINQLRSLPVARV